MNKFVISVDIGGTNIRTGLVDIEGSGSNISSISTLPEKGIENAAERLSELIQETINNMIPKSEEITNYITGIGISSAGPINPLDGKYNFPPNLPTWHNKSLIPIIKKNFHPLPVMIGHDATLAALAETSLGENKNIKNL